MTKREYVNFQKVHAQFMKRLGITNLSTIEGFTEPFFSWSTCECCNGLAGDRYECNGFNPTTREIIEATVCQDCVYYAEYGCLDDTTMMEMQD